MTPETARSGAHAVVSGLLATHSMNAEAIFARRYFTETFQIAVEELLSMRDYWNVGGVQYGDRLLCLNAIVEALNHPELDPLRNQAA